MIIKEIRDLFKARIYECSPGLRYDDQIFDTENISYNAIDRTYKLVVGDSSITRLNSSYQAVTNVTVSIFRSLSLKKEDDFSDLYETAFEIAGNLVDQEKLDQSGFIKLITNTLITPEVIDIDDNSLRVKLEFIVQTFYSV